MLLLRLLLLSPPYFPHLHGLSYKSIIQIQKREKSAGFFCGQKYHWTKGLRIELLASLHRSIGFEVSLVKRPKSISETGSIGRVGLLGRSIGWLLRMDLHSTWQLLHHRAFDEVIARAVQSATLRLLTLWSAGSTTRSTD